MPTIRQAAPGDAWAIAQVHVRSWQATYRGHVPQDFLDGLDVGERAGRWRRHLARCREREVVLVTEVEGSVAGFASLGPSRVDDAEDAGEIYALYLLSERWGQGIGRELMAAAMQALSSFGFTTATLWVLDGNERARHFYEAGGWCPDGAVKQDESFGFPLSELRYRRSIPRK